jgi:hypothetical protein
MTPTAANETVTATAYERDGATHSSLTFKGKDLDVVMAKADTDLPLDKFVLVQGEDTIEMAGAQENRTRHASHAGLQRGRLLAIRVPVDGKIVWRKWT